MTSSPREPRRSPRLTRQQWGAVWLLLLSQFLVILDTTGFFLALASIGEEFDVPVDQTGLVNLGYAVTLAVMMPLSGWLGERFGTVRVLMAGLAVLIVGSFLCAVAGSLELVVVGRVVQGIGSGGLVPLALSLMFRNFEPMRRLRITAALSLPIALGPALGPFIGGVLVELLSWRWVFLLNVPISAAALAIGLLVASEPQNRAVRRLDVRGAVLSTLAFGGTVLGIERLATSDDLVVGLSSTAIGVVALCLLIPLERRLGDRAFLNLNLFRHRVFAKSVSLLAVHSISFMGFALAGPLLLQTQLGLTPFQAGLLGIAAAVGPAVSGRFARRLIIRFGPRSIIAVSQTGIMIGYSIVVAGYALLSPGLIAFGLFFTGAMSLLTIISTQTVGYAAVPHEHLGDGTALEGTARQLGSAVGMAVVSVALAGAIGFGSPMIGTVAIVFGALAVFNVAALVILASPGRMPLPPRPDATRLDPSEL